MVEVLSEHLFGDRLGRLRPQPCHLSFELGLPIACEVGQTCFIQNYVDHDPSAGARDYMCGHETSDGHDGTDFRLPSVAQEQAAVVVLAAADGQVLRTRDGMPDTWRKAACA